MPARIAERICHWLGAATTADLEEEHRVVVEYRQAERMDNLENRIVALETEMVALQIPIEWTIKPPPDNPPATSDGEPRTESATTSTCETIAVNDAMLDAGKAAYKDTISGPLVEIDDNAVVTNIFTAMMEARDED